MKATLLQDAISVALSSYPPPSFNDEAAVAAWVGTLATGLTHVAYDAILSDVPKALEACAETYSAEDVETAYNACCSAAPTKIGDGKILAFLQSINWAQLIQTVITIISIIPKTPTPAV